LQEKNNCSEKKLQQFSANKETALYACESYIRYYCTVSQSSEFYGVEIMDKKFSFKNTVLDNLDKSWETCVRSLGESDESDEIVKRAARECKVVHQKNIAEINRQRGHFLKKMFGIKNNLRKDTGVRTIHSTGSDVFRELTSVYLDIAEIDQETGTDKESITDEQFYFRFFRAVFSINVLRKGTFSVCAAFLGVIRRIPTDTIKNICAYLRGISPASNTEHYNYKNAQDFDHEIAKAKINLYKRFAESERFMDEEVEKALPTTIRKLLKKETPKVIKLEPTTEGGANYIYKTIGLIGPWEGKSLEVDDIPNEPFSFHPIKKLIYSDKNPVDERDYEIRRMKTIFKKETGDLILKNQSVRHDTMENNHLHSPLIGSTGLPSWTPVYAISAALIESVKNEQLDQSWAFQSDEISGLIINIDGREYQSLEEVTEIDKTLSIPVGTRVVSVYGKIKGFGNDAFLLPLGSLIVDLNNLKEDKPWESESKLPNGFHLKIKLVPELNDERQLNSLMLTVNYHRNYQCEYQSWFQNQVMKWWSTATGKLKKLIPAEPFPKPVEAYVNSMETLGIFKTRGVIGKVLASTTLLAILIVVISVLLRYITNFFGLGRPRFSIVWVSTVFFIVSASLLFFSLFKRKGLNTTMTECVNTGFLGGVVFLAILSSTHVNKVMERTMIPSPVREKQPTVMNQKSEETREVFLNPSKNTVGIVMPVIATEARRENKENQKSMSTSSFIARSINPLKLKTGSRIQAIVDKKNTVKKIGNDSPEVAGVVDTNEDDLKCLSATVVSISKEMDNESVVLVRFRFDKLLYNDGQEVALPKGQDTIIAMDTKNTNQIIKLNVSEISYPHANR
jgi:hypothetical protein